MDDFQNLKLSPYYLNTRRIVELTGVDIPVIAQRTLNENSGERAGAMRFASKVASEWLKSGSIPSLTRVFVTQGEQSMPLVASIWAVFTFRGLTDAVIRERSGRTKRPATFSATVPLADQEFLISGELSNDHLYSDTTVTLLSNKRRVLLVGRFELRDGGLEVHPYIIGDIFEDAGSGFSLPWSRSVRAYPETIEIFHG